uniref:Calponin-homology (CH) domain-containing protein n=2 Tax=Caenorhabditis tropicalis TaxID=1561998 RepID=A0A1I7UXP1_9PELO
MGSLENRKEAMLKRLAERNESRILKNRSSNIGKTVDLRTTEKAFLDTSPSAINMKTPLDPSETVTKITVSPILSSEERADKQIVALATWANTLIDIDSSEEIDLGATAAEATRRIQRMLRGEKKPIVNKPSMYQNILGNKDHTKVREACQKLLADSEMEQSIRSMLSKKRLEIRKELSVYNDLTLQTTLLRIFLSFNPKLLKVVLEAIFKTEIGAPLIRNISQMLIEKVFSNPAMLKNKKYAQGSGVPIITAAGRKALHDHFLEMSMKIMFLVESTYSHRLIPSVTRVFTKSSQFKCLDEMFNELTRELLTGSSQDFGKAFSSIGFEPTYVQSFFENHNYEAKGFEDFSDGLILAKLIETVGELPHGSVLYKLRDPAGDRIRKIKNVEMVLKKMVDLGISTDDVKASTIVGGKKEVIVSILWSIIGVRVAKEKRERYQRPPSDDQTTPKKKKRQSGVHDDMSTEVLAALNSYCRVLQMEVSNLNSIQDGCLLEQIWLQFIPNAPQIQTYSGASSWEKTVTFSEIELQIPRGIDQNVALFVKTFLERVEMIRKHEENKNSIELLNKKSSESDMQNSMNSTWNDATFTISRESIDSVLGGGSGFKMPITPLRGTFTRSTIAKHLNEVIEEEETEVEKNDSFEPKSTCYETHEATSDSIDCQFKSTESEEKQGETRVSKEDFPQTSSNSEALEENQDFSADQDTRNTENLDNAGIMRQKEKSEKKMSLQKTFEEYSDRLEECSHGIDNTVDENVGLEEKLINTQATEEDFEKTLVNTNSTFLDTDKTLTASVIVAHVQDTSNQVPITNAESSPRSEDISTEAVIPNSPKSSPILSNASSTPEKVNEAITVETSGEHALNVSTSTTDTPEPYLPESMIQMAEEQKRDSDFFQSYIENQKAFIAKNNLEIIITENQKSPSNTPELRKILRETRELKRKQLDVAKKLGTIERSTLGGLTPSCSTARDEDERSDAGHDEAMFINNETSNLEEKLRNLESDVKSLKKNSNVEERRAAVIIQKTIRGFLARRRFCQEIKERRERMIVYNRALEVEKQQLGSDKSSSLEMKLRHSALHGLTNNNLHVVHIAATIIDRITDLFPPLLEKFVVELNGIELIYAILEVTDQGYAYKAILQPLLHCLQKSFTSIPQSITNSKIQPILPKLSPRLFLLMLKHSTSPNFFNPIITTLIAIGRRFPTEKDSGMKRWKNQFDQTMNKVTDKDGRNYLITLRTICEHLL